jgi:hypothetical protein
MLRTVASYVLRTVICFAPLPQRHGQDAACTGRSAWMVAAASLRTARSTLEHDGRLSFSVGKSLILHARVIMSAASPLLTSSSLFPYLLTDTQWVDEQFASILKANFPLPLAGLDTLVGALLAFDLSQS